jgi:hypothetical protein
MDGKDSKVDKMSPTHPNSNPSDVIDSIMSRGTHGKKIIFRF